MGFGKGCTRGKSMFTYQYRQMYVHILTLRCRRHKKRDGYHFCNSFTTTAVMEVYGPACWACGTTMSCDIVHKKRNGPMHIKAEHRYLYFTRTNEYYGSETHSSRSCTQYDVHTYPYTSSYRPHKKREGSPFCNNAYTTTAVMEVLTCLLSMCYLLLCHRTQKANWTQKKGRVSFLY